MYSVSAIDKTNKNVWAWEKTCEDGSSLRVELSSDNWKPANAWTIEELDALFTTGNTTVANTQPVDIPTFEIKLDDGDYE